MADNKNKLKSLKDKLNYSASPKFLCMDKKPKTDGPAGAPKQPTTPPQKNDNDNAPDGKNVTSRQPGARPVPNQQQMEQIRRAQQAAAQRQQIKPSVETTRMGDHILVRLEITAEKEIETKFDFYTQTVSTETTYYVGGKKQIQPGPAVPFSKYAAHHVLERIRKDLISMGGQPEEINPPKNSAPNTSGGSAYKDTKMGFTSGLKF